MGRRIALLAWGLAVATMGAGDVVTTALGQAAGLREGNAVVAWLLATHGYEGFIAAKVAVLAVLAACHYGVVLDPDVPDDLGLAIPAGLAVAGALVTANNLFWLVA